MNYSVKKSLTFLPMLTSELWQVLMNLPALENLIKAQGYFMLMWLVKPKGILFGKFSQPVNVILVNSPKPVGKRSHHERHYIIN